ncbi:glycosyltransferase [bacterium]|nr:glycosyltransferase [bacterium]
MKTLLLSDSYPPMVGGVETMMQRIAERFTASEITVVTSSAKNSTAFDAACPYRIVRVEHSKPQNANIFQQLIHRVLSPTLLKTWHYFKPVHALLQQEKFDIIQCGTLRMAFVACLIKMTTGVPYTIYIHGDEILMGEHWRTKIGDRLLRNPVLNNSDAIFAISEFTKQLMLQWPIEKDRVIRIPAGADLVEEATVQPEAFQLARTLGIENKSILLSVSRLVQHKGHEQVVRALPQVIKRVPNLVYLIVGRGPSEGSLKRLVQELQLEQHVQFLGYVPTNELPLYYQLCNSFIQTSLDLSHQRRIEGFGLVFLEANAWAKPVIGGRSGGIPDAIVDGVTGLLVDPTNVDEIAQAIITLLTDPNYAQDLGRNGKKRVEMEMNWDQTNKKVRQVLETIVHQRQDAKVLA